MKTRTWVIFAALLGVAVGSAQAAEVRETPTGTWARIYSPDVLTYAANLRAAGVPQTTIGVLISQEINARFKAREQALEPSLRSLQTLKEGWSAERREALIKLKHEKNELLRSALGSVPVETARIELVPAALASAPTQLRELVRLILEDYHAMNARVNTESRGYHSEEDKEKLHFLEDELIVDLGKAMGPELALDYQIERDGYMRAMQQRLELFKPTPQEMRDIYMVRRNTGLDIEARSRNGTRLIELQNAVLAELAKRWGAERFAQYGRLASSLYQQVYHLTRRLNLPAEIADQLYDSRKAAYEKAWKVVQQSRDARGVRSPSAGPPSPGQPRLTALAETGKEAVAEHCELAKRLLGESGYQEYYRFNSQWIDSMAKGHVMSPEIFERNLPL